MYVEFLRVRRALIIYAIVIVALTILNTVSLNIGHVHVVDSDPHIAKLHIPLTIVLTVAAFGSLLFGTLLAGSLNRERETLALSWTRPIPRERLALNYMLVDLAGVVVAFFITLLVGAVPLVTTHLISRIYVDSDVLTGVVLMLGVTVMWYGIVQAATSWYRGRAGLAVGLSWAFFILLLVIGHRGNFGPLVEAVTAALNYINPLAYASSYGSVEGYGMDTTSYLGLPENVRLLASWCIGIAACAVAIFAWKRSEA
jgi:ABC-type transport system involved in multi-copper enzyme maturation permease subunit